MPNVYRNIYSNIYGGPLGTVNPPSGGFRAFAHSGTGQPPPPPPSGYLVFNDLVYGKFDTGTFAPDGIVTPPVTGALWGVTVDDIANQQPIIDAASHLPTKITTRVVFDAGQPPTYYQAFITALRPFSNIMGELVDSSDVATTTAQQYHDKTASYLTALGNVVDIWEVGNEVNGEWLGTTSDVITKIADAYDQVKAKAKSAALTLYYNPNCWSDAGHEMFLWTDTNIPARMKTGLDYVLISYYEGDCNNHRITATEAQTIFDQLHAIFPNAKLGFGEVGLGNDAIVTDAASLSRAQDIMNWYYRLRPTTSGYNYIIGGFWWHWAQDAVPYTTSPLWDTFRQLELGAVGTPLILTAAITVTANANITSGSTTNMISAGVDHTGATDVTDDVQAFIDGLADGETGYLQPNGSYRCDGTIFIMDRAGITFDLNNSTMKPGNFTPTAPYAIAPYSTATTHVAAASDGDACPDKNSTVALSVTSSAGFLANDRIFVLDVRGTGTVLQFIVSAVNGDVVTVRNPDGYTGTFHTGQYVLKPKKGAKTPNGPADTQYDSHRANFIVKNSQNITIMNGTVFGASVQGGTPLEAYIPVVEEQHILNLIQTRGFIADGLLMGHCFGDFVFMGPNQQAVDKFNYDVTLQNCTMDRNGRVAISPMSVVGLTVTNNTIGNSRRAIYDIEPPGTTASGWTTKRMHCSGNHYGAHRLLFMSASGGGGGGHGADVGDISFNNETSTDTFNIEYWDVDEAKQIAYRRGPFSFTNNRITSGKQMGTPSGYNIACKFIDGVTVKNNTTPLQVRATNFGANGMYELLVHACTAVVCSGNVLDPADNAHQVKVV